MADQLYEKQADKYVKARPSYPASLFQKLAALTPQHELAWDVGTGNGQCAVKLAEHFKAVVATDISEQQVLHAKQKENVKYSVMSATPPLEELERIVGAEGSVDLVTVASALHWFDIDKFYPLVQRVLRKPGGVFAAFAYNFPQISPEVDEIAKRLRQLLEPYVPALLQWRMDDFSQIPFPFRPVGPKDAAERGLVEVETSGMEVPMTMEMFISLWKSTTPCQTALDNGLDVFDEDTRAALSNAWGSPDRELTAKYPIYLRVGTVFDSAPAE